jgi:hypothetical protein
MLTPKVLDVSAQNSRCSRRTASQPAKCSPWCPLDGGVLFEAQIPVGREVGGCRKTSEVEERERLEEATRGTKRRKRRRGTIAIEKRGEERDEQVSLLAFVEKVSSCASRKIWPLLGVTRVRSSSRPPTGNRFKERVLTIRSCIALASLTLTQAHAHLDTSPNRCRRYSSP